MKERTHPCVRATGILPVIGASKDARDAPTRGRRSSGSDMQF